LDCRARNTSETTGSIDDANVGQFFYSRNVRNLNGAILLAEKKLRATPSVKALVSESGHVAGRDTYLSIAEKSKLHCSWRRLLL